MNRRITVAIDGHSSCGKSTMARALATSVGYIYVDTGAMYRAVTLYAMRQGFFDEEGKLDVQALRDSMPCIRLSFLADGSAAGTPCIHLNDENVDERIRLMDVSQRVSLVASLPFVRETMVQQQRAIGAGGGIVMDGRDIGTAVFPDAEMKVFITARAEVRAQRRYDELKAKGEQPNYDEVLCNVQERDYIDSHREVSPLRRAEDALLLDNSEMSREEQQAWLMGEFARCVLNVTKGD